MADRGEQRRTHPIRFGERARGGGLLGEPLLPQCESGLGSERLDDAPIAGVERVAAQHQGQLTTVARVAGSRDGNLDVTLARERTRSATHARCDLPRRGVVLELGAARHLGSTLQQRDRFQAEGLPQPLQQRGEGTVTTQDAAGDRGQGGGFGAGLGSLAGSPRSQVDHGADR